MVIQLFPEFQCENKFFKNSRWSHKWKLLRRIFNLQFSKLLTTSLNENNKKFHPWDSRLHRWSKSNTFIFLVFSFLVRRHGEIFFFTFFFLRSVSNYPHIWRFFLGTGDCEEHLNSEKLLGKKERIEFVYSLRLTDVDSRSNEITCQNKKRKAREKEKKATKIYRLHLDCVI